MKQNQTQEISWLLKSNCRPELERGVLAAGAGGWHGWPTIDVAQAHLARLLAAPLCLRALRCSWPVPHFSSYSSVRTPAALTFGFQLSPMPKRANPALFLGADHRSSSDSATYVHVCVEGENWGSELVRALVSQLSQDVRGPVLLSCTVGRQMLWLINI